MRGSPQQASGSYREDDSTFLNTEYLLDQYAGRPPLRDVKRFLGEPLTPRNLADFQKRRKRIL